MKRGKPDVKRVIFCLLMFLPLLAVLTKTGIFSKQVVQ